MCDLTLRRNCDKSVAWIRLVKTENPIACVTVNCKVYKLAIAQQLPVDPSTVYQVSINPIIQSKTRLVNHAKSVHVTILSSCLWFGVPVGFPLVFSNCNLYALLLSPCCVYSTFHLDVIISAVLDKK
jgi:hypothetical protein